jgi:5-deoxy-glucuronate isomerase
MPGNVWPRPLGRGRGRGGARRAPWGWLVVRDGEGDGGPVGGDVRVSRAGRGSWRYLALPGGEGGAWAGFALVHLEPGGVAALEAAGLEAVAVPLRGGVAVSGPWGQLALQGRSDVWSAPTDVAYLPATPLRLQAGAAPCDVALGLAPADPTADGHGARRVDGVEVATERRGVGSTERVVRHLYPAEQPAGHLLVVEVLTPAGHWSSFPPHRHDEAPSALEEFYYCEVRPEARWAYLHVFDDPVADGRASHGDALDAALAVRHGDLVLVRHGYHLAACPPGSTLYYLNVMAGAGRAWTPTFHPACRDLVVGWERAPVASPDVRGPGGGSADGSGERFPVQEPGAAGRG